MSPPPDRLSKSSGKNQTHNIEPPAPLPPVVENSHPTAEPETTPTPTPEEKRHNVPIPPPEEPMQSPEEKRRNVPIPPPSEPMQYRAIGLVRGVYAPSEEQFTRGNLVVGEGQAIDAVLLGRVMSLVKNHLDLATEHLWVVYPRTRQQDGNLHVQIVGVWEPENLDKSVPISTEAEETAASPTPEESSAKETESESLQADDGYFSIRGEVIFQAQDKEQIVVKIRQTARNDKEKPKFFKLTLKGVLEKKAVGHFWDFQVQRQAEDLVIQQGEDIGQLRSRRPMKRPFNNRRPGGPGGGGAPRGPRKPGGPGGPGGGRPSRPIIGGGNKPTSDKPIPRPIKRQPQGGGEGNK